MKKDEFRGLVEDVSRCHICERIMTLPHMQSSECLENDDHGLKIDKPYVNRWNIWQGNLDAEIMVIGQDYGIKEDGVLDACMFADTSNPTDKTLKELFKAAFNWNLESEQQPLFFTNVANCYRKKRTSGGMHPGWLTICANKFMARLIRIVRPKIIIVLGRSAFEALHCMEDLPVVCLDPIISGKDSFAEMIQHRYYLEIDGRDVAVFPVYHPGANSKRNRSFSEQVEDWMKIAEHYKSVKG